ncbi:hypothetical protein BKA83DRAFT_4127277 [Pisolithus microcarpus]|nr:hypothetical protein BKA83DRAFT_4127277 [Pisolithus microcarpus]
MTWNNFGLSSTFQEFQSQCYSPVVPFLLTPTLPTFDRGSILVAKMRYTCLDHHQHELSDLTRRMTKLLRVRPLPVLCQGHTSRFASSQRHVVMHPEFEQVGQSMGFADWEIQYEVEEHRVCRTSSADVHSSGHSGLSFHCLGGFKGCLGVLCLCFLCGGGESNAAIVVVIIWYLTSCNYSNDMLGIEQYSSNIDSDDDSRQVFNQPPPKPPPP